MTFMMTMIHIPNVYTAFRLIMLTATKTTSEKMKGKNENPGGWGERETLVFKMEEETLERLEGIWQRSLGTQRISQGG